MEKKFDIIGMENGILDLALQIDRIPETDSHTRLSNYLWQPGGNASNAIAAAARQGAKCSFMGAVGDDSLGEFVRGDWAYHGVDTSHLMTKPGDTVLSVCLAEHETQGRSFLVRHSELDPDLAPEDLDEAFIASARYLHLSVWSGKQAKDAVLLARKNGVIVSVDGGGYLGDAAWLLENCDIMIMSFMFYRELFDAADEDYVGNMQKLIEKYGLDTCVVTLGSRGCAGANKKGETFVLPPFSGYDVIDTTGAGDVYHGGFVFAHSQGWDLEYCARYASAVSYIKCTTLGGRVGIPSRKVVEQFLKDGTIDHTEAEERRAHYAGVMRFR